MTLISLLIILGLTLIDVGNATPVYSGGCNCTLETGIPNLQCEYLDQFANTTYKCTYCPKKSTELGIQVGINATHRIPDDHMTSSSFLTKGGYSYKPERARINIAAVGSYGDGWCAGSSNPDGVWLQVAFGVPTDIERIVTKGIMVDNVEKYVMQYSVNYSIDGITWLKYRDGMAFNSSYAETSNSIYINQTKHIRLISKSPALDSCLRMAIYGCLGEISVPTVVIATSTANPIVPADKITEAQFIKGYQLWLVFLVMFLVVLAFSAFFLLCIMLRKERSKEVAKHDAVIKAAQMKDPRYDPPWRRIDPETEKGWIDNREIQQIEVPFDDETDIAREETEVAVDDEDFYNDKNLVFSFSGRLTEGEYINEVHGDAL
ncbi:uncharacterized protein LOC116614814 [Nematostella vectensis]|uniref:uncharacterized protein LOC116614814 n=1 Tax=Nematostella vectensis TaxID=45351 RepID=UPI002077829E|nr:uncharacterized protein LOC116614814 [Nematostella vectensis]